MAVSCFVMGQKLSQFASSDVKVEVDVQVGWLLVSFILASHWCSSCQLIVCSWGDFSSLTVWSLLGLHSRK